MLFGTPVSPIQVPGFGSQLHCRFQLLAVVHLGAVCDGLISQVLAVLMGIMN